MKTADIRRTFLQFFEQRGHTIVPSAPLVPANDPTLLFTNAGMVPFKNVFLGSEKRPYQRAVDVQRCLRAGGKHNDLDQVGYTARHHTFFEMLGNWSFGDYFKREAIAWSWELLTEVFGLAPERLWVTVYETDDEAFAIWRDDIGVPEARITRIGDNKRAPYASDNFWQMADTGPCGPCSEIFYDHGPEVPGGPPGTPEEDGDRYIEIWNLVFMQFDRQPDGEMRPLPAPCVDTGMGLERLAAILQGVHSNYEIDLFQHLISAAAQLTGCEDKGNKSLRVIADHVRAASFLIVDGVLPSNEGRGYVLRRIIRRALRHGWMLGVHEAFFWRMVTPLVAEMGEAYPELARQQAQVEKALQAEEKRFGETLENGMKLLGSAMKDDTQYIGTESKPKEIPGKVAFTLYDTYGFPVDLTADVAREHGWTVDMAGFDEAMQAQRARARAASHFRAADNLPAELAGSLAETKFLGYDRLEEAGCKVVGLVRDGSALQELGDGDKAVVILDRTPFYAESGGQVGDAGELVGNTGRFTVADTRKFGGALTGHIGQWQGETPLRVGDSLTARVDGPRRQATVLNHTATHLLHAALREVLGEHVTQKGSLVAPDRLRFDFSHNQPVSHEELRRIEALVNDHIRANHVGDVRHMGYDAAIEFGALALFGEKYGDEVRVLKLGDFSTELCGGTHVERTGDIGLFKIIGEGGVASGIRRIEALTGRVALDHVLGAEQQLAGVAETLSATPADVQARLAQILEQHKAVERELESLRAKAAGSVVGDLASAAIEVGGVHVVASRQDGFDVKALRESMDQLKQRLGDCVIMLASGKNGKATLVAGVHGAALEHVKAGQVVAHVAAQVNGKGGGRPDMAQGGGEDSPALDQALEALSGWLQEQLPAA